MWEQTEEAQDKHLRAKKEILSMERQKEGPTVGQTGGRAYFYYPPNRTPVSLKIKWECSALKESRQVPWGKFLQ